MIMTGYIKVKLMHIFSVAGMLIFSGGQHFASLQQAQQTGDVEPWVRLFLEGVRNEANDAFERARSIVALRERYRTVSASLSTNAVALVDVICETPVLTTRVVEDRIGVTRPTAIALLRQLEAAGILREERAGPRSQLRFAAYELIETITREAEDA